LEPFSGISDWLALGRSGFQLIVLF
jgi:hypothetical protein